MFVYRRIAVRGAPGRKPRRFAWLRVNLHAPVIMFGARTVPFAQRPKQRQAGGSVGRSSSLVEMNRLSL